MCVEFFDEAVSGSDRYAGYILLLTAQFQYGITMDPSINT